MLQYKYLEDIKNGEQEPEQESKQPEQQPESEYQAEQPLNNNRPHPTVWPILLNYIRKAT